MNENQQQVPQVVVAARKIDGEFQAVLLVKGEFERTFSGEDLDTVLRNALGAFTSPVYPNDTRVQITFNMSIPNVQPLVEKA